MRWNLQARASAAAAPPSAAEPAPSQASAAASRVLRAGSESRSPSSRRGRPRTVRPRARSPAHAGAGGWNYRAIAGAQRRAGGGGKWRRAGGTKWRRDPWGWARLAEDGARGPRACARWPAELPAWPCWGGGRPSPQAARVGLAGPWGRGSSQAHPLLFCLFGLSGPRRLDSAKEVMVARCTFLLKDRAGHGLGCGESPSPAN